MNMQFQRSNMQQGNVQPAQTSVSEGAVEPKKGSWLKWLLIIMAILIVAAGFFYWIFAP